MTKANLNSLLIVDDDSDILAIAKYGLQKLANINIKYCHSGEEAILEALAHKPDLILLDVTMPEMDGITVFHVIKLLPTLSNTPVIFLTGRVQKEELNHYAKLGIFDVIIKPFDPLTFSDAILQLWDKFQMHGAAF